MSTDKELMDFLEEWLGVKETPLQALCRTALLVGNWPIQELKDEQEG